MERIEIIDEERRLARRVVQEPEGKVWFAMSAPYCREMKAKEMLDARGIENFVAMRWVKVDGSRRRKLEPVIHNLIFVHEERATVQAVKAEIPFLQYRTMVEDGRNRPMVVPDRQMEQFIKVCMTYDKNLRFYDPNLTKFKKGDRVRITAGQFAGVEGTFIRSKGPSTRRVLVELPFLASVVTAALPSDQIEILEN